MFAFGIVVILGLTNRLGTEATDQWINNLTEPPAHSAADLQRQYEDNGQQIVEILHRLETSRDEISDEDAEAEDFFEAVESLRKAVLEQNNSNVHCGALLEARPPQKYHRVDRRVVEQCYSLQRQSIDVATWEAAGVALDRDLAEIAVIKKQESQANAKHLDNLERLKDARMLRQDVMRARLAREGKSRIVSSLPWAIGALGALGMVISSRRFKRKPYV